MQKGFPREMQKGTNYSIFFEVQNKSSYIYQPNAEQALFKQEKAAADAYAKPSNLRLHSGNLKG